MRGGSWNNNNENNFRCANRNNNDPTNRNNNNGFRCASTPQVRSRGLHGRRGRAWGSPGRVLVGRALLSVTAEYTTGGAVSVAAMRKRRAALRKEG